MYRLQDVILEKAPALITLMELTAQLDWYSNKHTDKSV